jgi:hypothetical protein
MQNFMSEIRTIIGEKYGVVKMEIFSSSEVCFSIYEKEIPIIVNLKTSAVYMDGALNESKMGSDILSELGEITKILENSLEDIKEFICIKED